MTSGGDCRLRRACEVRSNQARIELRYVRGILPHQSRPENLHPPTPGLYNLHMELKDHPPFELKARSAYWIDDAK
jgi:hypothetical protein